MENSTVASKSNKKIIAIVAVVAIVLVGAYFAYTKFFSGSPKSIFTKAINKNYEKFVDAIEIDGNSKYKDKAAKIEQKLGFDIDIDKSLTDEDTQKYIDEINKLGIITTTGVDSKNKTAIIGLDTTYDEKDMLSLLALFSKDKAYIKLKDVLDKYIEFDFDEYENLFTEAKTSDISEKDVKYVLNTAMKALLDNLDSKDFKKSNATISVNEKDTKVTKVSIGLSQKEANALAIKMVQQLKDDSKFVKIISDLSGEKESEIKDALKEAIEELKDAEDLDTEDVLFLTTYTKGITNDVVGYEISVSEGKQEVSMRIIKDSKTKSTITLKSGESEIAFILEKEKKGNTTTYKLTLDVQGVKVSLGLKVETIKADKEYKITLNIDAMSLVEVKITDEVKISYEDELEIPEIKDTIKAENMSEEDFKKIVTKVSENKTLNKFIEAINSIK